MRSLILFLIVWGAFMGHSFAGTEDGSFRVAVFAGGCFWCMQPPFDRAPGVISTTVGYTGGDKPSPSYEEVSSGRTGHLEAVQVVYDPLKISYKDLLKVFWLSIDPTDPGGQFADQGSQYRCAIFFSNDEERLEAEASRKELSDSGRFSKPVVTAVLPVRPFYPAEPYHQKYYRKQAASYKLYRQGSGREGFLKRVWKDQYRDDH
jgi:methionine-S-sulfoxide reductase